MYTCYERVVCPALRAILLAFGMHIEASLGALEFLGILGSALLGPTGSSLAPTELSSVLFVSVGIF